ncbi:MAG: hypothetical protein HY369_04270 [Candidatus Aenigmarchaeota archaeon]|nr:hypothetical protein [Candidatus Aenigmarchaeota archaeon]
MAPKTKSKAVSSEMEPPLIGALLDREIACQAHPGGVLVLDHYALLDLLEGAEAETPAGPSAVRKPKPLDPDAPNPVGIAQEYLQGLGKPLPEYGFEFIGTENVPLFRCTARALRRTGVAEANSKAQAKEQAARALIRDLQAGRRARP